MPIDLSRLFVGEKLPDVDWVLRGFLGQGGMGIVLDVMKPLLDRPSSVAVQDDDRAAKQNDGLLGAMKVIRPELAWRSEYVDGLVAETRVLLKIDHPNIVRVLDVGCFRDGTPYIVMEQLKGQTLRKLLDRYSPLPPEVAFEIMCQANEALDHAHNAGVIHQDFKPENVFVHNPHLPTQHQSNRSKPNIKVLDFGISAFRKNGGNVMGTPKYMAYEQLLGRPITPQTDVFASTLVLYELLTGQLPWPVPSGSIVQARLHMDPVPPSHVKPYISKKVDAIVMRGLARNPADRHRSCFELSEELYAVQAEPSATSINDTAPTLMTLTDVVRRANAAASPSPGGPGDTDEHVGEHSMDGRSLEDAPSEIQAEIQAQLARESEALRRKFTLRMVSAPPHPSVMAPPSIMPLPTIPAGASLHTPTAPVGPDSQAFPTFDPPDTGPDKVVIDDGASGLLDTPAAEAWSAGDETFFGSSPPPSAFASSEEARSGISVSGTARSVETSSRPTTFVRRRAPRSEFLRASFIVPISVLVAMGVGFVILMARLAPGGSLRRAAEGVAPAQAVEQPPAIGTASVSVPTIGPPAATLGAPSSSSAALASVNIPPRPSSSIASIPSLPPAASPRPIRPSAQPARAASSTVHPAGAANDDWKLLMGKP